MLTLDEAIKHCEEKEQEQALNSCFACAEEHKQLAEWLKQLQEVKKIVDDWHTIRDIQDAVDAMGCYFERIVDVFKD